MGTYRFIYEPSTEDGESGPDVAVRFTQTDDWTIGPVVEAFQQLLLGVTYQPGSIERFINVAALDAL